jgi:hypothetical protein
MLPDQNPVDLADAVAKAETPGLEVPKTPTGNWCDLGGPPTKNPEAPFCQAAKYPIV